MCSCRTLGRHPCRRPIEAGRRDRMTSDGKDKRSVGCAQRPQRKDTRGASRAPNRRATLETRRERSAHVRRTDRPRGSRPARGARPSVRLRARRGGRKFSGLVPDAEYTLPCEGRMAVLKPSVDDSHNHAFAELVAMGPGKSKEDVLGNSRQETCRTFDH